VRWLVAIALVGCAEEAAATVAWRIDGDAERGRALFVSMECARCHTREDVSAPPPDRDCAGCHRRIHDGTFDAPAPVLARWRAHITDLVEVPSLDGCDKRLSRDWVAGFLRSPHDLRPSLEATMPRLAIDERAAADLATFLVPSAPVPSVLIEGDIARGRAAVERLACARCHAEGGDPLAPDLRFTRDRWQHGALVRWLRDPASMRPGTRMPAVAEQDVDAIAAYLLRGEIEAPARPAPTVRLPLLDRPVSFEEVRERVLRRSCWHCHSDAELALGDGGPGNTGGLGFEGRGVDLSDYEGVMAGSIEHGVRRSIFRPDTSGDPILIAVLRARADEERGVVRDDLRGMPLGLPSLDAEQIQLVETWIAQGRPQ
jgi:cytochrome c2